MKAILEFSGNYRETNSFLTIVELINYGLAIEQKPNLFKFVYNVKLTSTVRTSLGTSTPVTFDEFKNTLSNRYKFIKTVVQLQATLSNFTQKNMNVHTYHEKLLQMIADVCEVLLLLASFLYSFFTVNVMLRLY